MRNHFISLFDATHLRRTIYLFVIAAVLIIASFLAGENETLLTIFLLAGIISLFFTVLHPWKKASNYWILVGVCIGILLLILLGITVLDKMGKGESVNDNITEGIILLVCVPGIIVGITGAIICAVNSKSKS
jgi:hypothetical protein